MESIEGTLKDEQACLIEELMDFMIVECRYVEMKLLEKI